MAISMNVNKTHNHNIIILVHVGPQRCTAYHHYYSKVLFHIPYNKTIIDFHGGKYRVILTQSLP